MGEQRGPGRLVLAAEGLGVITALSFAVSGLANGAFFYLKWKLNYFVIASPADVVMTAFMFVAAAIAGILIVTAICSIIFILYYAVMVIYLAVILRDPEALWSTWAVTYGEDGVTRYLGLTWRAWSVVLVAAGGISGIVLGISLFAFTQPESVEPAPPRKGESRAPRQFSYVTGLRVAPDNDKVPADCWAAPVLWMGTERVVLGCQNGLRVISKLEEIVTQPVDIPLPPRKTSRSLLPAGTSVSSPETKRPLKPLPGASGGR